MDLVFLFNQRQVVVAQNFEEVKGLVAVLVLSKSNYSKSQRVVNICETTRRKFLYAKVMGAPIDKMSMLHVIVAVREK